MGQQERAGSGGAELPREAAGGRRVFWEQTPWLVAVSRAMEPHPLASL